MRADQLLVARGLAASRSQAARLVAAGLIWFDGRAWRTATKSGDEIPEQAEIKLADAAEAKFVSRGGLKLEGALADSKLNVEGLKCLDVGQSTGGFTDCLLQQGARHVTGIDVGHGQLHQKLRDDPRVTCIEKVNARSLTSDDLGTADQDGFDAIVGDVSFISLTLVLPALVDQMRFDASLLFLVKPQFELQPEDIGKGGIVKDPAMYSVVENRLRDACETLQLKVLGWWPSAIEGGDGNKEFFIYAKRK